MRSIYLFRTNLKELEYYHKFKTLDEFKKGCHDFYLIQGLWLLENNIIDEFIVWRLKPEPSYIGNSFILRNGGRFYQRFVDKFEDIFNPLYNYNHKPMISFFRGGFPEYDHLVSKYPNGLGKTLYLGAGQRTTPKYSGEYDKILVENDEDLKKIPNSIPFFKTCNPEIFHMNKREPMYDICFLANFTQKEYKGQRFFLNAIASSSFLKSLDIVHFGNKPEIGERWCKELNITNVKFGGHKSRTFLNQIINKSKFGLVCSNLKDGCPRVITEILCCGTPLLLRNTTRLLNYYKTNNVIVFGDKEVDKKIKWAFDNYDKIKQEAINNLKNVHIDKICDVNYKLWLT